MDVFGISVAGLETCVEVPSLRLLFDMGRCTGTAIHQPVVCLSHGHLDHMGAVAQHAARRALLKLGDSTYVVPAAIHEQVEQLFNAAGALDGQNIPRRVVPLGPGESFSLGKNRAVRPFETFHRVPSQGYTVWERRHHLRPEFRDLPGARLGELRRQGVSVDEEHDVALLSFTGDTRVEVLERNPELQHTELLIMETTFLDGRVTVADTREMGHIHLDEVLERVDLLPQGTIVFSHFSGRYRRDEIEPLLLGRAPESLHGRIRALPRRAPSASRRE